MKNICKSYRVGNHIVINQFFILKLCPTGWFTCKSGGITCIDKRFICDCSSDCDDGSDETSGYAGCPGTVIAQCAENSAGLVF